MPLDGYPVKEEKKLKKLGKMGGVHEIFKNKILYLMFLPIFIYYLLLAYLPMSGIVMAFEQFQTKPGGSGVWLSPWIGLKNFEFFFYSGKALQVTLNTILYNLFFLTYTTFFAILVAIFVAEMRGRFYKKITQSFMFLPYFISWVVVSSLVNNFFNYDYGIINQIIKALGGAPLDIYSNPGIWPFLLPFLYGWKWIGFNSVIYLAAIMGIDPEVHEAATIDGANIFRRTWYITLPSIRPIMVILILLGIGRVMRGEFDMFYNLIGNNGLLIDNTDIVDTLVFRSILGTQDFGMASAAGLYQSVLCFVIILTVNTIVKRYNKDYALF
jgi:putative aldouronate transport system permease protein